MSAIFFRPIGGPIIVEARATGPKRSRDLRLILDTGATSTLIHLPYLIDLGFDPQRDGRPVQITTASAVELATKVMPTRLFALGQNRIGFPVIAHTLPDDAPVDGLLGLDFFRGHVLTLDFRAGSITLA